MTDEQQAILDEARTVIRRALEKDLHRELAVGDAFVVNGTRVVIKELDYENNRVVYEITPPPYPVCIQTDVKLFKP